MLHVINKFTLIRIANLFCVALSPDATAVLLPIFENTCVWVTVGPVIFSPALGRSVNVFADKFVAISEGVLTLAMPETVPPLTFESVAIRPLMNPVPMSHIAYPLADIRIPRFIAPHPVTILLALAPLSIIEIAIGPIIDTFSWHFAVVVLPLVNVSIAEFFIALTVALVILPRAFKVPSILVNTDAQPVSLVRLMAHFASKETVLVIFDTKQFWGFQLLYPWHKVSKCLQVWKSGIVCVIVLNGAAFQAFCLCGWL
jgi:hypothetical protein